MVRTAQLRATISPLICDHGAATQSDRLTTLPTELQQMIMDQIPQEADRTCLALACKKMAQLHRAQKAPARAKQYSPEQKVNFLLRLRNLSALQRFRLCFECCKFRVVKGKGAWGGLIRNRDYQVVNRKIRIKGPNCPACVKANAAKVKTLARSVKAAKS